MVQCVHGKEVESKKIKCRLESLVYANRIDFTVKKKQQQQKNTNIRVSSTFI